MNEKKGKLIIADRDYWPFLLSLRAKNPKEDIKVIDPEVFLDMVNFAYAEDPVPLLMKNGWGYSKAKKWARIIRVAEPSTEEPLASIQALLKPLEKVDPLGMREVSAREIVLFEMKEDLELHRVCEKKGLVYSDAGFTDFGAKRLFDETKDTFDVLSFPNRFEQCFYLFAHLRERLLAHPEEVNKIAVHTDDKDDCFYIRLCADLFEVPVFIRLSTPLWSAPEVSKKMVSIFANKKIAFDEEETAKSLHIKAMKDLVDKYGLMDMPFEQGYPNLQEILTGQKVMTIESEAGPVVYNNWCIETNAEVYVLDFVDGSFYKSFDDKNVLSDAQLEEIGANPSYVLTELDKRKKLNFLRYNKLAMVSRIQEHLNDKIYDSAFLSEWDEEYHFDKKVWKSATKKIGIEGGVYTTRALKVLQAHSLDKAFYRKPVNDLLSYDPSFKGIPSWKVEGGKVWSVTNLESYVNCPFQYLMKQLLPSYDSDYHAAMMGTLIHKIFESSLDPEFDFEKAFAAGVEAYKEDAKKKKQEFGPKEEALLEIYKRGLKNVILTPRLWTKEAAIYTAVPETAIHWTLEDEKGKYDFTGRIDRLIYFGKDSAQFYYVGDYKTGNEVFSPRSVFLGKSIQLPLYAYALKQEENKDFTKGATFSGFGIQTCFFSDSKPASKGNFLSYEKLQAKMRLKGVVLQKEDFWALGDSSSIQLEDKNAKVEKWICTYDGSFINGAGRFQDEKTGDILRKAETKAERQNKSTKKATEKEYCYGEMEQDAINAALSIIHAVENGEFPIAPTGSKLEQKVTTRNVACRYCAYGDICFSKGGKTVRDLSQVIKERFALPPSQKEDAADGKEGE